MNKKGFAGMVVVLIVAAILLVGGAWYYETHKSQANFSGNVTSAGQASPATTTPSFATDTLKTYTNQQYGFTFQYPASWTVSQNSTGSIVTVQDNVPLSTGGLSLASGLVITLRALNDSAFGIVHANPNEIQYDPTSTTFMNIDSNPPSCLSAKYQIGIAIGSPVSYPVVSYGGSMMSDPATANYAILTDKGYMILFDITEEAPGDPAEAAFYSSLKFINGVQPVVPHCPS